jgi:polysaccharide export outer membrane protein
MRITIHLLRPVVGCLLFVSTAFGTAAAQITVPVNSTSDGTIGPAPNAPTPKALPDYLIGQDDVLTIAVWGEKELSGDFTVRPDGKISMLLVNEVSAAGLTTEQLREILNKGYLPFIEAPNVSVTVKAINSRRVFISGYVPRPGMYALGSNLSVVQLISIAGGLLDYADQKNIIVLRAEPDEKGQPVSLRVNYEDISKGRNLRQNVALKPGDTVIVR